MKKNYDSADACMPTGCTSCETHSMKGQVTV